MESEKPKKKKRRRKLKPVWPILKRIISITREMDQHREGSMLHQRYKTRAVAEFHKLVQVRVNQKLNRKDRYLGKLSIIRRKLKMYIKELNKEP